MFGTICPISWIQCINETGNKLTQASKEPIVFFRGTKYIHEILGEVKTNSNNTNNDLTNPLKLSFKTKLTSVLVDIISLKNAKHQVKHIFVVGL